MLAARGFHDHIASCIEQLTLRWMNNDTGCAVGLENDREPRLDIAPSRPSPRLLVHGQGETVAFIRILRIGIC